MLPPVNRNISQAAARACAWIFVGMLVSVGARPVHAEEPSGRTADESPEEAPTTATAEATEAEAEQGGTRHVDTNALRFRDRRQVLFRVSFGGEYQDAFLDNPDAQAGYGATLRWERPVHEYLTTGLGFSATGYKAELFSRQPFFEASIFLKGRYPFEMGKKERKFEAEAYLLGELGFVVWIDSNALDLNLIGPGFAAGVVAGYLFFINDRIGLVAELGWTYNEALYARGRGSVLVHQGLARTGLIFPF